MFGASFRKDPAMTVTIKEGEIAHTPWGASYSVQRVEGEPLWGTDRRNGLPMRLDTDPEWRKRNMPWIED